MARAAVMVLAALMTQTRSSMSSAARSARAPLLACFARLPAPAAGARVPLRGVCLQPLGAAPPRADSQHANALSTSMRSRRKSDEPYDPPNINRMQTDDSDSYAPRGPALFVPQFEFEEHVKGAWEHWEAMGSPKYVMAPMVDQSELGLWRTCSRPAMCARSRPCAHRQSACLCSISSDGTKVRLRPRVHPDAAQQDFCGDEALPPRPLPD